MLPPLDDYESLRERASIVAGQSATRALTRIRLDPHLPT